MKAVTLQRIEEEWTGRRGDMKPLHCLGIAGSPRRNGNSSLALDQVLKGAQDAGAVTEKVVLCDLNFSPCIACDGCFPQGECVLVDDLQQVYPKLLTADRIVLAAPIYGMGINAQTKAFIDRCQPFWATKYVRHQKVITNMTQTGRKGLYVGVAGSEFSDVFDGAERVAKYFFHVLEAAYSGSLCYRKLDGAGQILEQPAVLNELYAAGYNLAKS
jgi:putative NADPH-quinone reductase